MLKITIKLKIEITIFQVFYSFCCTFRIISYFCSVGGDSLGVCRDIESTPNETT